MHVRARLAATIPLLGLLVICCAQSRAADADVPKELAPRTITLQDTNIVLTKALQELAGQTGSQVEDRRREKEEIKLLKLDLKNATFWQALDAML